MAKRPSADLRIVPLGEVHDRAGFICEVGSLERYLKIQAGQDVRRKANAVFVLSSESEPERLLGSERVLGYCTLCAMATSQGEVPEAARKHVPRYPLVSCTLIRRLAIAKDELGQRLGSILLADALLRAFESASAVGSHGGRCARRGCCRLLRGAWLCAAAGLVASRYAKCARLVMRAER